MCQSTFFRKCTLLLLPAVRLHINLGQIETILPEFVAEHVQEDDLETFGRHLNKFKSRATCFYQKHVARDIYW